MIVVTLKENKSNKRVGGDIKMKSDDLVLPNTLIHISYFAGGQFTISIDIDVKDYDISRINKISYVDMCTLLDSISTMPDNICVCSHHIVYVRDGIAYVCSNDAILTLQYHTIKYWGFKTAYCMKSICDRIRYSMRFRKILKQIRSERSSEKIQSEICNIYGLEE